MLNRIVEFSLQHRMLIIVITCLIVIAGAETVRHLPIDAVPDITNVQVVVNAKTGGLDPQQVEKTVTYFIETEMAGLPKVQEVRSLSKFGLSQTTVIFEDSTDIFWARQLVSEKLETISDMIPEGISAEMAPITTGLGEVLMYAVLPKEGSNLSKKKETDQLTYLRTIQDFTIRPYLKANIEGIAEADAIGGYKKQIQIAIHPSKMERYGITFDELVHQLETLGENYGGGYIEQNKQQIIVRTLGHVSLKNLRNIPVRLDVFGNPIRLKQIAQVKEGHVQRVGAASYKGKETVLGTVLMLLGANSREVALNAEQALKGVPLPDDVKVEVLYSRSYLVNTTIKTVAKNLAEGALLVVLILLLILGNFRAAVIVAIAIPLSMAAALLGMNYFGISANLMSLGAIDFGLLVDGSVVMIENIIRRLEEHEAPTIKDKLNLIRESASEVVKPMTIGLLIIMVVYIPILSLEGVEGKMYYPMATTVLIALGASLVVALAIMPVLAYIFIKKPKPGKKEPIFFRVIHKIYEPILTFSLKRRLVVLLPALVITAGSFYLFSRIGSDFMPPLDEGDMLINLVSDSKISLSESTEKSKQTERIIGKFPEVRTVFSRTGTGEAATDPMGSNLTDVFMILEKDKSKWRKNKKGEVITKSELYQIAKKELAEVLEETKQLEETEIVQTQPIAMRLNEILEGSRADVSLRIYGKDLNVLTEMQNQSVEILEKIPGAEEVELDAITALKKNPVLDAKLDYDKIAYYGIPVQEVNSTLQTAMTGLEIGSYYEYDWRFPIVVRMDERYRTSKSSIGNILVPLPGQNGTIPLSKLTNLTIKDNVTAIARSQSRRYAGIAIFIGERDTLSFVEEAKEKIRKNLKIPKGYDLSWGGQFENLERAKARLAIIVPAVLLVIFLLLFSNFNSIKQTILIYLSIPFAMTGGMLSLYFTGINFSVSAAVGFIALTGIAILNGLVMVTFFNQLREQGKSLADTVKEGALIRLRAVIMTAMVASLGFLPMALNTGIGAEVQRPLATVVIGGLITSTILTLLLLPMLYSWFEKEK